MERETAIHDLVREDQSRDSKDAAAGVRAVAAPPSAGLAEAAATLDLRLVIGPLVLFGLLVLVFWEFFHRQVRWAIVQQADWGHTLVIPFIAGYFIYRNRHQILSAAAGDDRGSVFRTTWVALVPIVLGVAAYLISAVGPQAFNHHNIKGAGFGLALFGLLLLFVGFSAMRWLWFPLAYLIVFGQTISDQVMHLVTFKMQDIAAYGSEKLFILLGMDVTRAGNVLTLFYGGEAHPLNIAEACSGMRMLMAFLALGVAMAYTGLNRNWQRVLLVALAVPIAIFVNMLRVVTLGFLSIFDSEFAAGDFHTFVGLVWLIPAFLLFLGAMWVVKQIVIEEAPALSSAATKGIPRVPLFDRRAPRAFVVACATLLLVGLGFRVAVAQLNIYLTKLPVELREKFPTIPRTLDNWQAVGQDAQFDAALVESLGTDEYLDRTYIRRTRPGAEQSELDPKQNLPIYVHLAYYTGMIDAVPHIPDRCFLAGGFVRVGLPEVLDVTIDTSSWSLDPAGAVNRASGRPYHTLSFDHRITGRPVNVRMPIGIEPAASEQSGDESAESVSLSGGRGVVRVRTTEFRVPDRSDSRVYAGFFFVANGQVTPYPVAVRALAFDRTDRYAYYCKVQFTMEGGQDFTRADFAAQVGELLDELLPEIMRCLPDWAEIEAQDDPAPKQLSELSESAP